MSNDIFLCGYEKLDEKGKQKMKEYLRYLDEQDKSTKHPMFPNEDTTVTCGRHSGSSCTQAHDSHVAGLIERDHEIEELKQRLISAADEHAELICAKDALIEVLRMAVPQKPAKEQLILKTEFGEEEPALLIPQVEVESVLERFAGAEEDENKPS